ncbi:hypothetical protein EsH8_VII_000108 [Colletotrichum jinshuiense]
MFQPLPVTAEQCVNGQIVGATLPTLPSTQTTQPSVGSSSLPALTEQTSGDPETLTSSRAFLTNATSDGFALPGRTRAATTSTPLNRILSSTTTGPAVSSSPSTSTPKTQTATTNTIPEPACSSQAVGSFIPSRNVDIDRNSGDRLNAVSEVSLNYAEVPGNRVMQVELMGSKKFVVLEYAAQITSVACKNDTSPPELTAVFTDASSASRVSGSWAVGGVVLITNTAGCNLNTARGFWEVVSFRQIRFGSGISVTFIVNERRIFDVASQINLVYGTADASGAKSFTSTARGAASIPAAPAQTCSTTTAFSSTASSTSAAPTTSLPASIPSDGNRPLPETLEDLTPAARELYDYLLANIKIVDGNIDYFVPPQKGHEIPVKPYDPNDLGDQQAIEDEFAAAGLDKPSVLLAKAADGLAKAAENVCVSEPAATKRELLQPYLQTRRERFVKARARRFGDWLSSKLKARKEDDGWDIACADTMTELVGLLPGGKALELVCAGKSIYDNRDAIKCLFGGCKTTTVVVTKTMTYDFNYSWTITFPTISQWLTRTGPNKVLSCVNCAFSVTSISFIGKIIVVITDGNLEIRQADVTPGISGTAYMIARLEADGPYSGSWSHNYKNTDLGPIQMDGAFRINPTVIYGIGIDFSTDSKVDVTGGAKFSWGSSDATINILQRRLSSQRNWQPDVQFTLPSFKQGSAVVLYPYMRWVVKITVSIYGMVNLEPSLTTQAVVGIDSSYSFTRTAFCAANNLAVNTFFYSYSSVAFGDGGSSAVLYKGQRASVRQCFAVPGITPSPDEIDALRAYPGEYCTRYINYRPPTTFTYTTQTSYVPSTTTEDVTVQVTTTTTIYEIKTTKYDTYKTRTFSETTTTVTANDKTAQFSYQNYRRGLEEPMPTATAAVAKRQDTPPLVANWDATKISFACKQIATGTVTLTYTTSTTVTSGVVTATHTITENLNGPLVTRTNTITSTRFLGIKTVAPPGSVATETVCPPSSVNTCFKIKVHGCPWVEDKYIRYSRFGGFQPESFYGTDYVFYLTTTGRLIGYIPGGPSLVLGTSYPFVNPNYWGEVYMRDVSQPANGYQYATCTKDTDPCSKGLTCSIIDAGGVERVGMSLQVPDFAPYSNFDDGTSSNSFRPAWFKLPDTAYYKWLPFTMTYEDVPCPC